ncbi:hypothetical protein N9N67_09775 [Bacteriovoracaceae bacterium]|nr:hypothetical protein [Bacteriovoracaceae bacterium]
MKIKLRQTFPLFWMTAMIVSTTCYSLIPLDGVILGKVRESYQYDPVKDLFSSSLEKEKRIYPDEFLKQYIGLHYQGLKLKRSCNRKLPVRYGSTKDEYQARRSVIATLQYIGLDRTVKAIGAFSRRLGLNKEEYSNLSHNLMTNYCSQNISIYSHRLLQDNLSFYYTKPDFSVIPSFIDGVYPAKYLAKVKEDLFLKRSLKLTIQNFKAFCSWGQDNEEKRMLPPYLRHEFIMSFIYNELQNKRVLVDKESTQVYLTHKDNTVKVLCEYQICRRTQDEEFEKKFPQMVGSINVRSDLEILYCEDFLLSNLQFQNQPEVILKWVKHQEDLYTYLEVGNFYSLLTGIADPMLMAENMEDFNSLLQEGVNNRFNQWAKTEGDKFSKEILFEEPLMVEVANLEEKYRWKNDDHRVQINYTLGNFDLTLDQTDKISASFNLAFNQKYLDFIKRSYFFAFSTEENEDENHIRELFYQEVKKQFATKEKYFKYKVWNDDVIRDVSEEILRQIASVPQKKNYFLERYKNNLIKVELNFGLFALKYMYRKFNVYTLNKASLE